MSRSLLRHSLFLGLILPVLFLAACQNREHVPDPSSEQYREAVTSFYSSLAAIQAGSDIGAQEGLLRVTELAPGEPAAWANLGLLALRRNELEQAGEWLARAAELAPDNAQILLLQARLASNQGNFEQAIQLLRQAIERDPTNIEARYALAQEIERQAGPEWEFEVQQLVDEMLATRPDNVALQIESVRIAARRGDRATLDRGVARLEEASAAWPPEVREQLDALRNVVASGDLNQAATQAIFLRNALLRVPAFRQDLSEIQTPNEQVGALITHFIRMPTPEAVSAEPDLDLTYTQDSETQPEATSLTWAAAFWPTGEEAPLVATLGNGTLQIGGTIIPVPPTLTRAAALDYNYDFLMDIVLAGPGGLRLYRQTGNEYTDVTTSLNLPSGVADRSYTGVWPADLDMEGDIDVLLGTRSGAPLALRNNGDGTFTPIQPFTGVEGTHDFVWADLDADGDPDAALIDASGSLRVFSNERNGLFTPRSVPQEHQASQGLTAADIDSDGIIDLITVGTDGSIYRLTSNLEGSAWTAVQIARVEDGTGEIIRLIPADLDNNGSLDLIVSSPGGTQIFLSSTEDQLQPLSTTIPALIYDTADLDEDGMLDLIGLSPEGRMVQLLGQGTKKYHWQVIRPRAAQATGDQRINSFGIGGVVELRSELLYQQQPITKAVLHFGLGDRTETDVARIIWPNGDVQAEFNLAADDVLRTRQRLKGSCPWLFTYDGQRMQFVTDFLWRSPLGLAINAQESAGVMTTEDWVKIPGDMLKPKDGFYDVRITAELWETHFFDHVSLLVVDHPEDVDIFVDERFAFPPPEMKVHVTTPIQPVTRAWDDLGTDVTEIVRDRDERYLGTFGTGDYQGITRDHYVEIEFGDEVPTDGPLHLVAYGWVRPTDSSINVAISQGEHAPPTPLSVEVPDGKGGWRVARENVGFPAGKTKTILIDLEDVFIPGAPRRVRLRTNLEVYWDQLAWAMLVPDTQIRTRRIMPEVADLRYRGFSAVTEKDKTSPELPDYETLEGTAPRWQDLVGYHTRFGDVRELLETVDDRYVIMNAGDEMRFLFPEAGPVPEGWVRDYVLIGDGWEKDGDLNTLFSKTVLPLPSHDNPEYNTPPTRLEDDPVYQRHKEDWQTYHTRYVTPERFRRALVVDAD